MNQAVGWFISKRRAIVLGSTLLGFTLAFQNCSPVNFSSASSGLPANQQGNGEGGVGGEGTNTHILGPGDTQDTPASVDVGVAIKTMKPSMAVRGLQCILCHAKVESNIITDFGYPGPNFSASISGSPTFNAVDNVYGNARKPWQSSSIAGSVYVPRASFSAADASRIFGDSALTNFRLVMDSPTLNAGGPAMSTNIAPPSGDKIYERNQVLISYPTEAEILALVPGSAGGTHVGPTANAGANSSVTGLVVDSGRGVVKSTGAVTCKGDIVVKGTLFLNDLLLDTDAKGCRLYVSESVFIQGAIRYSSSRNLQITSARAIVMGFSAKRLGANADGSRNTNDQDPAFSGTPGGPWLRLSKAIDERYEPGIPVASRGQLADKIVADSVKIGTDLKDAADPAVVANPPPGTSVSNNRISVDYTGVLLNAPHIHSRYEGSVKGIMIADVAIFLLGSGATNAHFVYDPVFDDAPQILPALSRKIFDVSGD